jgi:exodeoxyribonuclease-1
VFERIRNSDPQALVSRPPQFTDSRGPELLRRYVGRNYYEVLPEQEQRRWMSFCAGRLLAPELEDALDYGRFRRKVENMLGRTDVAPAQKAILRELRDYADWLSQTVLRSA